MIELSEQTQIMWDTLRRVATETLEHKRRLGEYAVIWQDGKPVFTEGDAPSVLDGAYPLPATPVVLINERFGRHDDPL